MQKTETAGATDGAGAKVWCWGCNLRCWGWNPSSPSAGYGPAGSPKGNLGSLSVYCPFYRAKRVP